jgi:hypothetical protein
MSFEEEARTQLSCIRAEQENLRQMLMTLLNREQVKESYSTEEVAKKLGKRPWTVRQWCNLGQVPGAKHTAGRGKSGEWRIPHEVLVKLQNEGPTPLKRARVGAAA